VTELEGPAAAASVDRVFRDTLIYGIGDVFVRAAAVITIPIYTRIFSPEEFGVLSFVLTAALLLSAVVIVGGDSAYTRYFFATPDHASRKVLTSTWFAFLTLEATLISVALLPFTDALSEWAFDTERYASLFTLALVTTPVVLLATMCGQTLRNEFRAAAFAAQNVLMFAVGVGAGLVLVLGFDRGLGGVIAGTLIGAVAVLPARLWSVRSYLGPVFSPDLLGKLLRFGLPLVPGSIAFWTMLVSDRLLLGKLGSISELGLYAVASGVAAVLLFANAAFAQAWSPHALLEYERDPVAATLFYARVLTYLLAGFGVLAIVVCAFAPELVGMLADESYGGAAQAVPALALGAWAYVTTNVTSLGLALAYRTALLPFLAVGGAILNVVLNVALVPSYGMLGSAWATAAAYTAVTVSYAVVSQRYVRIPYQVRHGTVAVGLTLGFAAATLVLPGGRAHAAAAALCVLGYVGALVATGVLTRRQLGRLTPVRWPRQS
jgi:O-antigen/teichoic acid export membrane protein